MRIRVKERRQETPDIWTFVFALDGQSYTYTAGQFAFFELDELTDADPRGKRRHFTLSSSPTEDGIVQCTTQLRGSAFKETLRTAPLGAGVNLEEAQGDFTLPDTWDAPLVFLGGGVGVTPFRSMLRYATDENLPYRITMLYSAASPEHLAFRREFELMPQENPNLEIILTVTDTGAHTWQGETGRIDAAKIERSVTDIANAMFYICGPPRMVEAMGQLLNGLKVSPERVRVERFSGYDR